MRILILTFLILWLVPLFWIAHASGMFIPDTEAKVDQLADAIWKAEGGTKTKYPYGIKSVSCDGEQECRRICKNTIRNNVRRWRDALSRGYKGSYLNFLANRYCPPHLNEINRFWGKNVRFFLSQ